MIHGRKTAIRYAYKYSNGSENKPGLSLNWRTGQKKPPSIKSMQGNGVRKVPITLPAIPESRILTKEELK
jgi:hypothetical protein